MAAQLSLAASSTGGVAIRAEDIVITAFEIASAATADPIGCENGVFTTAVRSQFVVGTKDATGAATVEVTGDPVCVAARRLLQETGASGAAVEYVAKSSDPDKAAEMATKMADTAAFAETMKASINAAPGPIPTIANIIESAPAISTKIEYEVKIPAGSTVSAASVQSTTSDTTAMATVSNYARVVSPFIQNITATSVTATATTTMESESNGVDVVPAPSTATASYVSFKLTLPGELTTFSGSAANERTFKTAYKKDIASHLGITKNEVLIKGWVSGSVVIETVTTGGVTAAQINSKFATNTSVPFANLGNSGLAGFPTTLAITTGLFETAAVVGTGATPTPTPTPTPSPAASPATAGGGISTGVVVVLIIAGVVLLGIAAILYYRSAMDSGRRQSRVYEIGTSKKLDPTTSPIDGP